MSSTPRPKPLFLDSQRLLQPIEDPGLLKKIVCDGFLPKDEELGGPAANLWTDYPRQKFVNNAAGKSPHRRVAVMCDAGMGKSTTTKWLAAQFYELKDSRQVLLYLRMDDAASKEALFNEFKTPISRAFSCFTMGKDSIAISSGPS